MHEKSTGNKSLFFIILFQFTYLISYAQIEWVQRISSDQIDNTEQHVLYNGDIFVCGYFHGAIQIGEFTFQSRGESDIFLYRSKPDGTIVWAKSLGGPSYDGDVGLGIDDAGNIYFSGGFIEGLYMDNSLLLTATSNYWNSFFSKFDENGNLIWIKGILGATSTTEVRNWGNIAIGENGFVLTAGFSGNLSINGQIISGTPFVDNFLIASFDLDGDLNWTTVKTGINFSSKVVVDDVGFIYISGEFWGTLNFDAYSITAKHPDHSDVFIVKLNASGYTEWIKGGIKSTSRADNNTPTSLTVDPTGNVYLVGVFKGDVLFEPITLHGNTDPDYSIIDSFLIKYNSTGDVIYAIKYGDAFDAYLTDIVHSPYGVFLLGTATSQFQFFYSILNENNPSGSTPVFLEGNGFPHQLTIYDDNTQFVSGMVNLIEEEYSGGYWDGFLIKVKFCAVPIPSKPLSLDGPQAPCPEETVTYITNEVDYADKYIWDVPLFFSPNGTITTETNEIVLKVNSFGTGNISVYAENMCQQNGDVFQTSVMVPEKLVKPTINRMLCDRELSIDQGGVIEWFKNGLLLADEVESTLAVMNAGIYSVQISNKCSTVLSEPIEVYPKLDSDTHSIPNVITPNGDNKNEVFQIDQSLPHSMITIFNRWGQAVYKSDSYDNTWRGDGVSAGVYYYHLENACLNNPYKGTIHVLK